MATTPGSSGLDDEGGKKGGKLFEGEKGSEFEEKGEAVVGGIVVVESAEEAGREPGRVEDRLVAAGVESEQRADDVQILEMGGEIVQHGGMLEDVVREDVQLVAAERFHDHREAQGVAGNHGGGNPYWGL